MTTRRDLPSIEQLRQRTAIQALERRFGRMLLMQALRAEVDGLRAGLAADSPAMDLGAAIESGVAARLEADVAPSLRAVINATGVIVHTNLGRAPLAEAAVARVAALAGGYTNLEYDLALGTRGRRDVHAERLLRTLTGAEAAVVVNNNAAATLVVLAAIASGREALIARGELIEIGGGFRIPEVMAQSGVRLREVGTTNRTRVSDYAAAISDRTAAIVRVHPSNFTVEGFTERPALAGLVGLGRRFNVRILEDQGSGFLGAGPTASALRHEPSVAASVAAGADLVMFSGDKLLGGPQCGIIAGTAAAVSLVRQHPLMRAIRIDKMTCAALEATLVEFLTGRAAETVPVAAMIALSEEAIARRAESLVAALAAAAVPASLTGGHSTIGGGSAPGSLLPTTLVAIDPAAAPAARLEAALRRGTPPVIARIDDDRVVLDLRTVPPRQDALLATLIAAALSLTS
jgi:L-seryl-tRNA(Ser) seleniumtransferase